MTDRPNSLRTQPPARANSLRNQPDSRGHFGAFGGRYVAETLMPLILALEREYRAAQADPAFKAEFDYRSEEHTSELQSLMRISYAVFCLKKKHKQINIKTHNKLSSTITT